MRLGKFLATTAVAVIVAGGASASTISDIVITSVTGEWTSVTGGTNVSGLTTNAISWGTTTPSGGPQSGYTFVGAAPPTQGPFLSDTVFTLGDFTHDNFPINSGTSITAATLEVTTDFTIGGTAGSLTSQFIFDHFETPNDPAGAPCAAGGPEPCGDLVTPTLNVGASDSLTIDGVDYFVSVTGFSMGASFLTAENASNTATLLGTFTADVAAIPLPAAGWMLLAGVGGLAALRRRKKAA